MHLNDLTSKILSCAFKVHSGLGPGLLESAYEECLFYELRNNGIFVEKQKALPLIYDEIHLDIGFRVDLLVAHTVVVEVKAVDKLNDRHLAQILTYLKLTDCRLGLLLNFNVRSLKTGIKRVVNDYQIENRL